MPQTAERKSQYAKERRAVHGDAMRAKAAEWRAANREHLKAKNTARRATKRAMCLVAAARIRARRKGIAFALGPDDVAELQRQIDLGFCQLSSVRLTLDGPRCATSPSLDRINPALGYVSGNVRIVCHAINCALGDWGEAELRRIVDRWIVSDR